MASRALALALLAALGCQAPRNEDYSRVPGLRPGDIEECAQAMSSDLLSELTFMRSRRPSNSPPYRIGLGPVDNETNEPFVGASSEMIVQRIQTILFRAQRERRGQSGRVATFITLRESPRREIEKQRLVEEVGPTARGRLRDLLGVDFILTAVYHALDKYAGGKRLIEVYMTFELIDTVTAEIAWTHDYLVKTVTRG